MIDWLFIQTIPSLDNSGSWYARYRWDNMWATGRTRSRAILALKESSH